MSKNSAPQGSSKHASGTEKPREPGRFVKMLQKNGFAAPKFDDKALKSRRNRIVGQIILMAALVVPCWYLGGTSALVLYLATVLSYFACIIFLPDIARPLFWAVALHLGLQLMRLVGIGAIFIQTGFGEAGLQLLNLLEVLLVAALLVWLVWKPGIWPMSLLLVFDGVALVNAMPERGDVAIRPILMWMQLAWSLLAAIAMYFGLRKLGHFQFRTLKKLSRAGRKEQLSQYVIKAPADREKKISDIQRQDPVSKRKQKKGRR